MSGLKVVIEMGGEQVTGREEEWREWGCALGREGEGGVPGGVYKGMRSSWIEESISEAREVKMEASAMGLERDSSTGTGWISEKELGRGELKRVESAVMDKIEEEQVEDMLRLWERVYWQEVDERANTEGWSFL